MKAGELDGVRRLAADVADLVLPRFILPPRNERDATIPLLFEVEESPDISVALAAHWQQRPVLIDSTYIIDEFGRNKLSVWLPAMFERARVREVRAIPMALLTDLGEQEIPAFRAAIATRERIKLAICVPADQTDEHEFNATMNEVLSRLKLAPNDCAVMVDFGGSEFGDPGIVAPIISGALETLQDFGAWQLIIFQGTNYPETNPAQDDSAAVTTRGEWLAWKEAVKFDPMTAEYLTFGDYAADCAKMSFKKSQAPAIRHIRYATSDSWRIQRAAKSGTDTHRMHCVYRSIFDHHDFAGAAFSQADAFIAHAAKNPTANPGNAKTWRQINTTHHITQAVADIARVRGIAIKKAAAIEFDTQLSLLD
jgi:hypothetical protein